MKRLSPILFCVCLLRLNAEPSAAPPAIPAATPPTAQKTATGGAAPATRALAEAEVSRAEPMTFTTTDGKVYEKVTIAKVEQDGLSIETDSGIEKIPFERLSANLQTKFGYDPAKAAAYAKQSQQAAAIYGQRAQQAAAVEEAARQKRLQEAEQEKKENENAERGVFSASYVMEKGSVGHFLRNDMTTGRIFLEGAGHNFGMVYGAQIKIAAVRTGVWRGGVETLPAYKLKAFGKVGR